MHRIDGPGATADKKFTEGDPVAGVPATVVTDDFMNDVQEELINLLVAAGITPVKGTQDQVLKSILKIQQDRLGNYGSFSIVAASSSLEVGKCYLVQLSGSTQTLPILANTANGATVTVAARLTTTLNVNGAGQINLSTGGSATSLVVRPGEQVQLVSNGSNAWSLAYHNKNPQYLANYTAMNTGGSGTAQTLTPTPALVAYEQYQTFLVQFQTSSGANPTFNVSGVGARPLIQTNSDGVGVAAVFKPGQIAYVSYDGNNWVILNPLPAAPVISVPTGTVVHHAANSAPSGYLKANGSVVSRTTYAALFAAIGTTFGAGDGSTTFGLPDLRANVVRGWDDSRNIDNGRAFGSEQLDAMQGHYHSPPPGGLQFIGTGTGTGSQQPANGTGNVGFLGTGGPVADGTNGTPRTAAETRMRNIALLACIKF